MYIIQSRIPNKAQQDLLLSFVHEDTVIVIESSTLCCCTCLIDHLFHLCSRSPLSGPSSPPPPYPPTPPCAVRNSMIRYLVLILPRETRQKTLSIVHHYSTMYKYRVNANLLYAREACPSRSDHSPSTGIPLRHLSRTCEANGSYFVSFPPSPFRSICLYVSLLTGIVIDVHSVVCTSTLIY